MISGILGVILFILCIFFCFYLPGRLFFAKCNLQLPPLELLFLSTILGVIFFLFVTYILAWIHSDWIAIPIYIVIDFFAFRRKTVLLTPLAKPDRLSSVLIIIFSLFFSIPLLFLGIYNGTILFHFDDMLAVALIQELRYRFPPNIPAVSGVRISSYHFFYDFLLARIHEFFAISPFSLHFHFIPVFFALCWGTGVYVLVSRWMKNRSTALLAVFLTMFAGSFSYVYYLAGHRSVSFLDGLGIAQPAYSVYNPRITFSMIVLLFSLTLLYHYLQTHKKRLLIPFVLGMGMLPMIDVYCAIVLYSGLGFLTLIELIRRRFILLLCWPIIAIFFLGTYGVFVGKSGGFLWDPLWAPIGILRSFIWLHYDDRMYNYTKSGNLVKITLLQVYGLFIFLILNLGTRIFGLLGLGIKFVKDSSRPSVFAWIIIVMTIVSIAIPLFLIQSGKVFEIIQLGFFYLFFCSIFAAIGLQYLFSRQTRLAVWAKIVVVIIFFLLTIPSTYVVYLQVIQAQTNRIPLNTPYYQALAFLRNRGNYSQTILQLPPAQFGDDVHGLYSWYNTLLPTAAAFADKQTFLASTTADFPGTNMNRRLADISLVLHYRDQPDTPTELAIEKMLLDNHIAYILSPYALKDLTNISGIRVIYDHSYVIYQVKL